MKSIAIGILLLKLSLLISCSSLPSLYQSLEEMTDEDAISVKVSNQTVQNKKDVSINIDVTTNK